MQKSPTERMSIRFKTFIFDVRIELYNLCHHFNNLGNLFILLFKFPLSLYLGDNLLLLRYIC